MMVVIVYMAIHSEVHPYKTESDTSLASAAHMQLALTLFCGLLIKVLGVLCGGALSCSLFACHAFCALCWARH